MNALLGQKTENENYNQQRSFTDIPRGNKVEGTKVRPNTAGCDKNGINKINISRIFQDEKEHLNGIYKELLTNPVPNKNKYFEIVKKCFTAISEINFLKNDLFEKIKNEKIIDFDRVILDCIMTGTSILCEISDEDRPISIKMSRDKAIMKIVTELIDNLHANIQPFSLSEQIMENIMFVCLNIVQHDKNTKINEITHRIERSITEIKMNAENNIIKFVFLLTIAYIWDDKYEINKNDIKTILNNKVEELEKYSKNSWSGLSKNEIQKGIECLSKLNKPCLN